MRIATGGYTNESNSFGTNLIDRQVLDAATQEGQAYFDTYTGVRTYCGGYIDEASALGIELIPTVQYNIRPCGPAIRETFEYARDRLVELLCAEYEKQPFDGIALFLHGAGKAQGYPDLESEVLHAIREKLGDIPIGVCLDLHGNICQSMVELSDVLVGCKQYPHVDEYETGRLTLRLLHDMIEKNYRPAKALVRLPWLLAPGFGLTAAGPAHDVMQQCLTREQEDEGLLAASFFHGFAYGDVARCGVSVVTVAKTQECADRQAKEIAEYAWSRRKDFGLPLHSAEEAVALALKEPEGPVIIHESSDNTGGGAPGDGTHLLRAMLEADVPSAFGFIYDPEVALLAAKAGVGSRVSCLLGAKTDKLHGEPIVLKDAYVKCVSDGRFVCKSPMGKGGRVDLGTSACLVVGNVSIVVASARQQAKDDNVFLIGGVDWEQLRILAVKSSQHFKGWWKDRVKAIISCDSPGIHSSDLTTLPLKHANLTYYPFTDAQWPPEE